MPPDGIGQWLQQGCRFANPIGQCGTIQLDPLASKYLALPVERQMIRILRNQHMGQKPGAGTSAFNRARGQQGLDDLLAATAGHARPHNTVHHETPSDLFQCLGDIVPKSFEFAAASPTRAPRLPSAAPEGPPPQASPRRTNVTDPCKVGTTW